MLNKQLLLDTMDLFKEQPRHWNYYVEFCNLKKEIIDSWYGRLKAQILVEFKNDTDIKCIVDDGPCSFYWELLSSIETPVNLWFEISPQEFPNEIWFSLYTGDSNILTTLVKMIQNSKFEKIQFAFGDSSLLLNYKGYLIVDKCQDVFEKLDLQTEQFSLDCFAWYAGNRTEIIVKELRKKVDKIKEVSTLLEELNQEAKKLMDVQNNL